MVLEAVVHAFEYFGNLGFVLFLFAGTIVGIIFGIIPGLSALLGVALVLPFVYKMSPEQGLPFILAIASTGVTGGGITSILINVPGTASNVPTLFDGFPMAQKGQAGRALGAALAGSGLGGVVSGLVALAMIPLLLPMILAMRTGDMVFVIALGLSFVGVLSGPSLLKGLISGGLGLLVSFIGFQPLTGVERFSFGNPYLYDGLALVPVALGIFALSEMVALAARGGSIAKAEIVVRGFQGVLEGVKDVFRHWGVWLRATVIGYIVGIIPGIGPGTASFVAYGQAKQTSKHPEFFGTGTVEGVIASESANNGSVGGDLLTTLALGIPGSATMALVIGAMLLLGLTPGPEMMTKHLDLSLGLLLVVIAANAIASIICLLLAPRLAKIALVPSNLLVPVVWVIILVGSYASQKFFSDVIMTVIFGVLGLAMSSFGYSRAAFFLGFILGSLFEKYLFIALAMSGPLFFLAPFSLTLILVMAALFGFQPMKSWFQHRRASRKV